MATWRGDTCKDNCGGHRAGASYFKRGGRSLTYSSSSFNEGMRTGQRLAKRRGVRSRLAHSKKSKQDTAQEMKMPKYSKNRGTVKSKSKKNRGSKKK